LFLFFYNIFSENVLESESMWNWGRRKNLRADVF